MFSFFFRYPLTAYQKGTFVLLGRWPVWVLVLCVATAALALLVLHWRRAEQSKGRAAFPWRRRIAILLLQSATVTLLLFLLWQPSLIVSTLQAQQNVIAVIIDDSQSMGLVEEGVERLARARQVLDAGLLAKLKSRFLIRTYRLSDRLERVDRLDTLAARGTVSQIGESLKSLAAEATSLPVGAAVLLSDGADNSGGIGLEAINEIRQQRIPIHTIGIGEESMRRDLEIVDAHVPPRSLPDSRLTARLVLRQRGFAGSTVRLIAREDGKVVAAQDVRLSDETRPQSVAVVFNSGGAGAKSLEFEVAALAEEENKRNNLVRRLLNVERLQPRILYVEGEPRWEYKFIRRALEQEKSLQLTSILRTTQNKLYRQGIQNPEEMELGFPATEEELFAFQGIVIGSVEASYFTRQQQDMIRNFADRRGGGVLFLGGRASLGDGGYGNAVLADILPVKVPASKSTFRREETAARLTTAGEESLICRIEEDPAKNRERWPKLPPLADYQDPGTPKPGALVLAETASARSVPLLITQNYGAGRTAVFATSGSWRWQMLQDISDKSHEVFWQQLLRWLVADAPGLVSSATPATVLADQKNVNIRSEVRDKSYRPVSDARVEARISGPGGLNALVQLHPKEGEMGVYTAAWTADAAGSYFTEVVALKGEEEVGRDLLMFQREDGVAESFRTEQNRELLEKLSLQTGGRYYTPGDAGKLADEISYSDAGITIKEAKDLWNLPVVFLLILALLAAQWLLRRRWGRI